ncbi:hypothetical protein DL546_000236 [Coniochaeta pulveracea]|uniref:Uncharacterized protein n=1 Tax=Coniochaeta pulveracea TaxID=177199 RepID=A0A420XXH0_9PEZI|nr:hypothetical protein DL546_000236 [Coniochaeta pulveracea]
MGRKRKTPKPTQVQHPERPAPGGGGICEMLDLKRCHEFRLKFAFYAANSYIQRLKGHDIAIKKRIKRRFDDQMSELITEAMCLHYDKREEDFSLLHTEPLVFWARIQKQLQECESKSFVLHAYITPHTLIQFFKLLRASWKECAGLPFSKSSTSASALSMSILVAAFYKSEFPGYDGPDPNVVYGEWERRVVTADGCDVELEGRGRGTTDGVHMMEGETGRNVYDELVQAGWDDEEHDDDEEYHEHVAKDDLTDMVEGIEEMQVDVDQAGDGVVVPEDHGTGRFDLTKLSEALPQ